ncbi:zinc-ribbon domain-containing protein [Szabonella alba]|uniref:Zinc-ribbon domain-containing protein n=1 Tax=Szabonella alba TaxID=2804194 RepID=A0A8K0VA81_9RHOB|nr:zinc-ribbon domain-containing protein [Szabonella alba]MBL4918337.1 zinc-ribbon domain-containing protein [Szabonella alba]
MRLICPNCDAQYEVDDSAIPDDGRDVQCSNCGHAWYQVPVGPSGMLAEDGAEYSVGPETDLHGMSEPEPAEETAFAAPRANGQHDVWNDDTEEDEAGPVTQGAGAGAIAGASAMLSDHAAQMHTDPPAAPDPDAADPDAAAPDDGPDAPLTATGPATPMPGPETAQPRRSLDENLLAVLKEEAEREAAARRAEQQRPIETQTDLGLEETGSSTALRNRLARLRAPEPELEPQPEDRTDPEAEITARPGARRDLLPDIEEINSTLRASSETRPGVDPLPRQDTTAARGGSGFRSGFFLMVFLAVLAASAYVAAPRIVEQFPAAQDMMTRYVNGVNHLRAGLDGLLMRATGSLQSMGGN